MSKYELVSISDQIKSNCVIESCKAKIKNPLKVKILYIPSKPLYGKKTFSLGWTDGEYDYKFSTFFPLSRGDKRKIFEGNIYKYEHGYLQDFITRLKTK